MTYQEAVEYIYSVPKFTKKNQPGNTLEMMKRLGYPDRKMKIIHVAGTNGKGSVCAFLSSILTRAGKRTGLFTSPHLVKINERFQINEQPVSDEVFLKAYEKVAQVIQEMVADGFAHPTYFEILFGTAMVLFETHQVEYLILETGLGGRMDATNVIEHPLVCVITSISLDHTEYLGDTVEKIAGEKAGIIKSGVPVVYDASVPEVAAVIEEKAAQMGSLAIGLKPDQYQILQNDDKSIAFSLNCQYYENVTVSVPFLADYQMANSSLALLACAVMAGGEEIPMQVRLDGIEKTNWQGRMETVLPHVVVDGAHNAAGVEAFIKTVQRMQQKYQITLLFSAVVEKDYEKMIREICEETILEQIYVTQIPGERIVPAQKLSGVFQKYTKAPVYTVESIKDAFSQANQAKKDGMLFCAGSLYLVGAIKSLIEEYTYD